ncbi:TPA: hypothetical protein ACI5KI_000376, partial [Streptococcus pneumoniae]
PLNKIELVSLGDCISPTPRNGEELERPVDVFSPVPLNKRELVSLGDCISPTPRNGEELERPVNIFTPTLRN